MRSLRPPRSEGAGMNHTEDDLATLRRWAREHLIPAMEAAPGVSHPSVADIRDGILGTIAQAVRRIGNLEESTCPAEEVE